MEKISVPYFDGIEVDLELETDTLEARVILKRFCELGAEDRLRDSRHVYAYYRDYRAAVGGEDWLDEEMGVPDKPEDIWRFVTPGSVHITRGHESDTALYVEMDAACGWEEEHGLMLVWKNGERLTKVGGYDGHPTNVSAYADETMHDTVYAGSDAEASTKLS